ncbi:MAG TPA: hypothetical protein VNO31_02890 [Umezawaea sp.]|nr:hypothetical protein [Umezawaea sp.]
MGQVNSTSNIFDRLKTIERRINEVYKKVGLSSATITKGGLTLLADAFLRMADDAGIEVVYFGPDNLGRQVIRIKREGGSNVFFTGFTVSGDQFWRLTDRFNREVVSDDTATGGMARPYLPVQFFPSFTMAAGLHSYMNLAASSITAETQLWEGRIGLVSHPYFVISGVWGTASGTNTTIYRVRVTGTEVATWTSNSLENNTKGPFLMAAYLGLQNVKVTLTAEATGSGNVACQVLNFIQRQTP